MVCEVCDMAAHFEVIISCLGCTRIIKIHLCPDHLRDPGPALEIKHVCR